MRRLIALVVVGLLSAQSLAGAAESPAGQMAAAASMAPGPAPMRGPLHGAVEREAARLVLARRDLRPQSQPGGRARVSWIGRHPALLGALIGAAGGAVFANVTDNETFCSGTSNDCLFPGGNKTLAGAGIGAGIGSLVGLVAGASRKQAARPRFSQAIGTR